jgi:hypothetical protein
VKTIAFFGGSNLTGAGYPNGIASIDIYPNIIASHGYIIKNYGISGASLNEIFVNCLYQLTQSPADPDIVFIEWNMLTRYKFYPAPGVELCINASEVKRPDTWKHCIPIPDKQLELFQKVLLLIDGDYARMITLLKYCEIIQNFCKIKNIELIMANGDISWTPDLFEEYTADSNLNSALSDYSKELLYFDNRDDHEILKLLSELRKHFNQLDLSQWAFIFENFPSMVIDQAPLDNHAGPKTMRIVADRIINLLEKKNL